MDTREAGRRGGKKRWAHTTKEERSEISRKMNRARWGKRRKKPSAPR